MAQQKSCSLKEVEEKIEELAAQVLEFKVYAALLKDEIKWYHDNHKKH
ncbi:hypothetical protein [Bacillus sp. JJ1562]